MTELRIANSADASALARLYGQAAGVPRHPVFARPISLADELTRPDRLWVVGSEGGEIVTAAGLRCEVENRVGKILWMLDSDPQAFTAPKPRLGAALGFLMQEAHLRWQLDLVYSTTRTYSLPQQQLTLDHGFSVLGVFPNAPSVDSSRVNGLTGWFADGLLLQRRVSEFSVHPILSGLVDVARSQCRFEPPGVLPTPDLPSFPDHVPQLELIEAPRFVAERYRQLSARRKLSINFYPFQLPNAVMTNPERTVEVFAGIDRKLRFATVIGEHIADGVDPVGLHRIVADTLHGAGVDYLELINDAADALSVECIVRAGYSPCAYFPCLKYAGDRRRDYVVFARTLRPVSGVLPTGTHPAYARYLGEFERVSTGGVRVAG